VPQSNLANLTILDALWDHEIEEMGDIDVNGNEVYVIHKIADAQVRKENIGKSCISFALVTANVST
jgi:hypothetical protein